MCSLIGSNCKVLARYYDINGCFHFPCHVSRARVPRDLRQKCRKCRETLYHESEPEPGSDAAHHGDEGCWRRIDILSSWLTEAQVIWVSTNSI